MNRSVTIFQPELPAYRIPFFVKLIAEGITDGIDYQVRIVSDDKVHVNREIPESCANNFVFLKRRTIHLGKRSIFLFNDLASNCGELLIAEFAIRNLAVFKWMFLNRPLRIALWGHGKTYTKSNTKFEEYLKTVLVNRSDWFFGYTEGGVNAVVAKGFPESRTTVVQNSTDTRLLKNLIRQLTLGEVSSYKKLLKIDGGHVGVFIGALDQSKRIDFLIEAATKIYALLPTFKLLIFGEGPELKTILEASEKNPFIRYCGRATAKHQALIANIADIILMPGRVGLVAVDSFALGLPIVTTNFKWHAPEFEYLTNGVNAIVCEDSVDTYSKTVIDALQNENVLIGLQRNCHKASNIYTIETMAKNFHEGVLAALATPARRR